MRMREPRSINFFEVEWAKVDEALEALDVDTLKEEEFIGARCAAATRQARSACSRACAISRASYGALTP